MKSDYMKSDYMKSNYMKFLCFVISVAWFVYGFNLLYSLVSNNRVERFENKTDVVDLPLTTAYTCDNFCGPTSRCSMTGHQCLSDLDCPGCKPVSATQTDQAEQMVDVPGNNDAGKMTAGLTPAYSSLTTDSGTQATVINPNVKPAQANFGVNTWRSSFDISRNEFDKKFKPSTFKNAPNYTKQYSLTGAFVEEGPLASNS